MSYDLHTPQIQTAELKKKQQQQQQNTKEKTDETETNKIT